jgi:Ser/Thr protein kinase RdoA (MazF antagonist)
MQPFDTLTHRGQLRRLRELGRRALADFGLSDARMTLINHGENTTYRIDGASIGTKPSRRSYLVPDRYVLRIHRSGYQSSESIESELNWIEALLSEGMVSVPQPLRTINGSLTTTADHPGVDGTRFCSVLCWLKGRSRENDPREQHLYELGRCMARLHNHAAAWPRPSAFTRRHWDSEGLFGDNSGFNLPAEHVWALVPAAYRDAFAEVAAASKDTFSTLGRSADVYGLIHADLHLGNVFFSGADVRVFDFDDCGFGHHLYDLVVPLSECMDSENRERLLASLITGYESIRSMPDAHIDHLDSFLAIRRVSLALWATDMAQMNERFREHLTGWITNLGEDVKEFLDGKTVFRKL